MKELNKRQLFGIGLAVCLMVLNIGFIFISIPILLIVLVDYRITQKKPKIEYEKEVPLEENNNIDELRAMVESIEKEKQKWLEYRRNVDLRQFKGRTDVTKEEVAKYLWYHKVWEGRKEKCIILEEIMRVSNLTEDDCKWILYEHYNHKGNDGRTGGGHWVRNEESRRIIEYERKKDAKLEQEFQKMYEYDKIFKDINPMFYEKLTKRKDEFENKRRDSDYWYIYHYEDWLKQKGYV